MLHFWKLCWMETIYSLGRRSHCINQFMWNIGNKREIKTGPPWGLGRPKARDLVLNLFVTPRPFRLSIYTSTCVTPSINMNSPKQQKLWNRHMMGTLLVMRQGYSRNMKYYWLLHTGNWNMGYLKPIGKGVLPPSHHKLMMNHWFLNVQASYWGVWRRK